MRSRHRSGNALHLNRCPRCSTRRHAAAFVMSREGFRDLRSANLRPFSGRMVLTRGYELGTRTCWGRVQRRLRWLGSDSGVVADTGGEQPPEGIEPGLSDRAGRT